MPEKFQSRPLFDSVSIFQDGVNGSLSPLLIPKTQLAAATNVSVRGGFATERPPFYKRDIDYPSPEIQEAIEQGLFQGSTYYQPDSGPQSLIAAISGRIFQFTILLDTVTAREITPATGGFDVTITKVWMWQSENYVIITDGQTLPIFFDGTSSRRSFGSTVVLANATAATGNVPEIGGSVDLTLTAPYTGELNIPVLFNGFFYQTAPAGSTYTVKLTTIYSPVAGSLPTGTSVNIEPQNRGYLEFTTTIPAGTYNPSVDYAFLHLTAAYAPTGGDYVLQASSGTWRQYDERSALTSGKDVAIRLNGIEPTLVFTAGTPVQVTGSAPTVLIGKTTAPFVIPPAGGSVNVQLDTPWTGATNTIVFAGGVQFFLEGVPPAAPGTTLTVINLNDPGAPNPYVFAPSLPINSVPELPAGRMGAYGHSQNWMSLVDGLSFIASDVSRGPSGTPANNFRDSVLKVVDSTFIGGNFAISGAGYVINSMTFTANLDVSLGQGPLQIGTAAGMFSCIAPFDFANPPSDSPIVAESLKGYGPLNQDATINANSDILFRSNAGLGSLILGRREFNSPQNWGNTPISEEMTQVFNLDTRSLLFYGSAISFDNRKFDTVSPQAGPQGVFHTGAVMTNYSPVSTLRGKQPPVYDGVWVGLNVLKYDKGIFGGVERAWAWTYNVALSKIELYELMPSGDLHFDNGTTRIRWEMETASLFGSDVKKPGERMRLTYGEIALGDVIGSVRVEAYLKADVGGCWTPWHTFEICSGNAGEPQYFPRLSLGETPAKTCDPILDTPLRDGYTFQVKLVFYGHCKFIRGDFEGLTIPQPAHARPICDADCPTT